jgi:hypothetical protein
VRRIIFVSSPITVNRCHAIWLITLL